MNIHIYLDALLQQWENDVLKPVGFWNENEQAIRFSAHFLQENDQFIKRFSVRICDVLQSDETQDQKAEDLFEAFQDMLNVYNRDLLRKKSIIDDAAKSAPNAHAFGSNPHPFWQMRRSFILSAIDATFNETALCSQ